MRMSTRVRVFLVATLLLMAVAPAVNLTKQGGWAQAPAQLWQAKTLYNLDFALPWLSGTLYGLGLSINPGHVVIGREGWLYLGDDHARSVSARRVAPGADVTQAASAIGVASKAWQARLQALGVRDYRVIAWPDKASIYPEHLPQWAQAGAPTPLDTLVQHSDASLFVDTRAALRSGKAQFAQPLYFKTDSHWNLLGAWVALREVATHAQRTGLPLRWPAPERMRSLGLQRSGGGDLARLLRLDGWLDEEVARAQFDAEGVDEVEISEFGSGARQHLGGNIFVTVDKQPLRVQSNHALNAVRVLWVRDSFGTPLSPLMAATFATTLQVHHQALDAKKLLQLVQAFKPDYVFVTVVERDIIDTLKRLGAP
jgi:alginate O-acetyltransferase complex protein AlgJ